MISTPTFARSFYCQFSKSVKVKKTRMIAWKSKVKTKHIRNMMSYERSAESSTTIDAGRFPAKPLAANSNGT